MLSTTTLYSEEILIIISCVPVEVIVETSAFMIKSFTLKSLRISSCAVTGISNLSIALLASCLEFLIYQS